MTQTPKAWSRNLMTAVVGLSSVLAVAGLILAVITLILRPQDGALLATTTALLLVSPLALLLLVVIPVVPIVTLRTAVRLCLLGDLDALQRTTSRLKLIAIPMFVQNFILCTVVVLALTLFPVAASRGLIIFAGPFAVLIIGFFSSVGLVPTVVGTYLMMLVTSSYGIACLALLRRRRVITKRFCVVNVILHAGFVTDIVSTLVVAYRARAVLVAGGRPAPPAPGRSVTRGPV